MEDNLQQRLQNLLKKGESADFKIIEYGIDFNVVRAYWALLNQNREDLDSDVKANQSENIHELSSEEQKKLLTHLGRSGEVKDYRTIERFLEETHEEEMKKWTVVALQHCRIHLENDLLDEPVGFIATGLGGKGMKIRYYFVLISNEELKPVMVSEIEANYREIVTEFDAEIEEVRQLSNYIIIKILCPINVPLSKIVEYGMENYPFLNDDYIATNMAVPDAGMIQDWINDKNSDAQLM